MKPPPEFWTEIVRLLRDLLRLLRAVILAEKWTPWIRTMITFVVVLPVIVFVLSSWPLR